MFANINFLKLAMFALGCIIPSYMSADSLRSVPIETGMPTGAPVSVATTVPTEAPIAVATAVTSDTEEVSTSIPELQARIAARKAELTRERERNGRLKNELLGGLNAGCMVQQSIKSMEIIVYGSHLPAGGGSKNDSKIPDQGNAGNIKYAFSESFVVQVADEETAQTFNSPGNVPISGDIYKNQIVGDIKGLKITKGGVRYVATAVTDSGFFSTETKQVSAEVNRYSLTGLIIKINGLEFYKNMGVSYTFEGANRVWEEKALEANKSYKEFMASDACVAN